MDDKSFMESFKSKDVLYYLNSHIRDLADLKETLMKLHFRIWRKCGKDMHMKKS